MRTSGPRTTGHSGSIQNEANPKRTVEGLIPFGLSKHPGQGLTQGGGIEPFGEVGQSIIAEFAADFQGGTGGAVCQSLKAMVRVFPQHRADHQGPKQHGGGKAGLRPAIPGLVEVAAQLELLEQKGFELGGGNRFPQRFCSRRHKTSSSALALRISVSFSRKLRPISTR